MGEIKREVRTYEVNYICDSCHQGRLFHIDETPTSQATLFAHKCEKCGERKFLADRYPLRRTE